LLEETRRTLAQAERAVALARRAGAGATGSLRIGFVASGACMPPLLARFRARYPEVALELTEATSAQQLAGLAADRLDVGLVVLPLPAGYEATVTTRTILRSRFVAALPATHRLAGSRRAMALSALASEPWILFPAHEGRGLHDVIMTACTRAGFVPQVAQRAVQMETIVGLVAAGLGVALVPEPMSDTRRRGVTLRALSGPGTPVPYEAALAWRRDDRSPVLMEFLKLASS
jgi:DNA-binding transcriptional LysR family regulator